MSYQDYQRRKQKERDLVILSARRENRKVRNRGNDYQTKISITDKPTFTPEGFLIVPIVIARKMVLEYPEYGTSELMGDDIFSKAFLDSCDGCVFVDDHPKDDNGEPMDVSPENYKELIKGIMYDPQPDRENGIVTGKLKVFDPALINAIKSGDLKELSQGYACKVLETPGEYNGKRYDCVQTNMIMNHQALVENGRAGESVKIVYNNSALRIGAAEIRRIERRRQNMKLDAFNKLPQAEQATVLKRFNMEPEMFKQLNEDGQKAILKADEEKENSDDQNMPGGLNQNPTNEEETPEQQSKEDARMKALEDKVNAIYNELAKLNKGPANAAPEDKGPMTNAEESEEKLDKKITNSAAKYIADTRRTHLLAQCILGDAAEELAFRTNGLEDFTKAVLLAHGVKKETVSRMNSTSAKVMLEYIADQVKDEINAPVRTNSIGYSQTGDRMLTGNDAF